MEKESQNIFDKNVIEFVTVAAEYCIFIEKASEMQSIEFIDKALKILPLLYLKVSLLPHQERIGDDFLENYVSEQLYENIRHRIAALLTDKDDYLEVFVPDMIYSDQPIRQSISEGLTDIYQDIRDFIYIFQQGLNETMNDSLAVCQENFKTIWGQKLVNTLRALHEVKYNSELFDEESNNSLDIE